MLIIFLRLESELSLRLRLGGGSSSELGEIRLRLG